MNLRAFGADSDIEHFESVSPKMSRAAVDGQRRLQLAAFGRRYDFDLRANPRLAKVAASSGVELLAGTIDGMPGSWARMSVRDGVLRGLFWDGRELFVIDAPPDDARQAAGPAVLFRLLDATSGQRIPLAGDVREAPRDAVEGYRVLEKELRAVSARAAGAFTRLGVSVLGDAPFRARYGSDSLALEAILTRMNNVDGIFSAQVGVELHVDSVNVGDSVTTTLSVTSDPSQLLDELGRLRQQNATLYASGLTHLFTGNDFSGSTVGIAYSDGLCSRRFAASITSAHSSAATDALITAHEIGHVFGAPHDGDQECASTPQERFIMSPALVGGVTSFSQCSLDAMQVAIDSASCLSELAPDLSLARDLGSEAAGVSRDFVWTIRIANDGAGLATNGSVTVRVAPELTIVSGSTAGGACTVQVGSMTCGLPAIAAQASETLTMTVRGGTEGAFAIQAEVAVAGDARSANNSGSGTFTVSATGTVTTPPPTPPPPADDSGGGGGGTLDVWTLLALLSVWMWGWRRARPALTQPASASVPRNSE